MSIFSMRDLRNYSFMSQDKGFPCSRCKKNSFVLTQISKDYQICYNCLSENSFKIQMEISEDIKEIARIKAESKFNHFKNKEDRSLFNTDTIDNYYTYFLAEECFNRFIFENKINVDINKIEIRAEKTIYYPQFNWKFAYPTSLNPDGKTLIICFIRKLDNITKCLFYGFIDGNKIKEFPKVKRNAISNYHYFIENYEIPLSKLIDFKELKEKKE